MLSGSLGLQPPRSGRPCEQQRSRGLWRALVEGVTGVGGLWAAPRQLSPAGRAVEGRLVPTGESLGPDGRHWAGSLSWPDLVLPRCSLLGPRFPP